MNLKKSFVICASYLFLIHSVSAAPGDLDLGKFVSLANQELEKIYGAKNLEPEVSLYFQDGVGVGSAVLSDYATLTVLRKPKFTPEHALIDRVGFRLELNGTLRPVNVHIGTCASPICQSPAPGAVALGFAFPGSIMFSFGKSPITVAQMKAIADKVKSAYPHAQITLLEAIFIIQVDAGPLDMPGIVSQVSQVEQYSGFDLNFEMYAFPIEFDAALEIKQTSGVLDLDKLRTITEYYKKQGVPFTTETTIPPTLKP